MPAFGARRARGSGAGGDAARACALRMLAELRKRVAFCDLGGKALSSIEYLTDGGRDAAGRARGRHRAPARRGAAAARGAGGGGGPGGRRLAARRSGRPSGRRSWARLTAETRDDLLPPSDPARDVLVIDFAGFESESFGLSCAARFVAEAVRLGWRNLVGFGCLGGPRYLGANLADEDGAPARGVVFELFGRESGDFLGALLEGAEIWLYGQAQCHVGMKADSGYLFVLQDGLNTCFYAAHGGTLSLWDSGSRFAVAGQNKVLLADGRHAGAGPQVDPLRLAQRVRLRVPHVGRRELAARRHGPGQARCPRRARPAAAALRRQVLHVGGGRRSRAGLRSRARARPGPVPRQRRLRDRRRGVARADRLPSSPPRRAAAACPCASKATSSSCACGGEWRRFRYDEAFLQLIPQKVARKLAKQGVTPPQLEQIVGE